VQDIVDVVAPLAARGATRYDLLFEPDPAPYDESLWDEWDAGLAPSAPLEVSSLAPSCEPPQLSGNLSPHERVESLLGPAPVAVDDLARASGCSVGEIRLILQELEIEGRIERQSGDRVALIS
jgi:DNA processing protein